MNAVKDVAAALGDLINSTKLASGKPIHDPAMNDLKESAKVCLLHCLYIAMYVSSTRKTVETIFCVATNRIYRFLSFEMLIMIRGV